MRKHLTILFLMVLLFSCSLCSSAADTGIYLTKPTGLYGVGFQDFDWIRNLDGNCERDDQFSRDPQDYSPNNPKRCHETVVRIYYPAAIPAGQPGDFYYPPFIKHYQQTLENFRVLHPDLLTEEQIQQLGTIKSYAAKNTPVVVGKFPVLLFSPGMDMPAELYENFMTELASHGYIVAGISTPFLNPTEINGRLVDFKCCSDDLALRQQHDLEYVLEQINLLNKISNSILFSSMDVKHIGIFGHSIGGETAAIITHKYENDPQKLFQAAIALDIGYLDGEEKSEAFKIPFMHQARSSKLPGMTPIWEPHIYGLGENGFLVEISPSEKTLDYSGHMSFSDISTLQYAPALKAYYAYQRYSTDAFVGVGDGWAITEAINLYLVKFFNIFVKEKHDPTLKKCEILSKFTYLKCGPSVAGNR